MISKKLGLITLTALVAGNMIGSGIFILPADLAKIGTISLFSWGITAVGAFLFAFVFSRMSSLIEEDGGPYAYARSVFGDFGGFQVVYNYWASLWIGNAALAIAMIGYISIVYPSLNHTLIGGLLAICGIWIIAIINMFGMRASSVTQVITTILKLFPIMLVAFLGWKYFTMANIQSELHLANYETYSGLKDGISLTLWAFIGLESATVIPRSSIDKPSRNVPLATMLGVLIAAVAYILSSTVITGMFPMTTLASSVSPFAQAAITILGDWGKWIVVVGAAISCFGCINGRMLIQNQITLAAAKDGLFPDLFGVCNKRGVPVLGLLMTTVLISVLLYLASIPSMHPHFHTIIMLALLSALIPYLFTSSANIISLKRQGQLGFKDKAYLVIAFLATIYAFGIICVSGPDTIFYGAILFLSSIPLYVM